MTTYNTGNPLGSSDPRDLYDNAENLDSLVNGDQPAYNDRLGQSRKSWAGMESEFDTDQDDRASQFAAFIAASGYEFLGDYAAGIEITGYQQVVRDANGEFWRLSGSTSLPYTTTGAGLPEGGAFVAVGDAVLRQELAQDVSTGNGASLVNGATIYVGSVAELVSIPTPSTESRYETTSYHPGWSVMMQRPKGGAQFVWDAGRDKADHNGGTVIDPGKAFPADWTLTAAVTSWFTAGGVGTGCFVFVGESVYADHFGAFGDGSKDDLIAINQAIIHSGVVKFSHRSVYGISGPILMKRGTLLQGDATFDDQTGRGAQIKLLSGSNATMLKTEAANGGTPTHYYGIENLVFDGNKTGQTVENDGVQFWGAWVGSWLRNVFIKDVLGQGLTAQKGSDFQIDHVWILNCQTANGYAFNTNEDITGTARQGLLYINMLYVENTSNKAGGLPRTAPEDRGNGVRLHRLVTCHITEIHTEGMRRPVDIESNHLIKIGKLSSIWSCLDTDTDAAIVRYVDSSTRAVSIGAMECVYSESGTKLVGLADGVSSNNLQELPIDNPTVPYSNYYSAVNSPGFGTSRQCPTIFANSAGVQAVGSASTAYLRLYNSALSGSYHLKLNGTSFTLGSDINQSGDNPFMEFFSYGNAGDRVDFKEPFRLPVRAAASNIAPTAVWEFDDGGAYAYGNGPVYQRTVGDINGSDFIMTARRGVGAPSVNADYLGQVYIDVSASPRQAYIAINVDTGASDWRQMTV